MRAAPDPRTLTGWSGASPHALQVSPTGFPPVSRLPTGFSPSPAFLWFPFVRRSPVRSLKPCYPVPVPLRVPFPRASFTIALPAGGSAGVGPGRQGPRSPVPPRSPAWIARSARTTDAQRLGTMGCHHGIACYERTPARDAAAPEPPDPAGLRLAASAG